LNKANDLAQELGDQQLLAMGYANLMQYHMRLNEFNKAIELGRQAKSILKVKPILQLEAKVDSIMYVSFKEIKDHQNAVLFLENYIQIKDHIRSEIQKKN
jgi:hypothetical protein